jgi:uncharacterized protein (TIGR02246 family)
MQNDEQAIRDLIATWLAASRRGDHDRVLELMSDDVVFLIAGHPPMRGKSPFAAAQSGLQGIRIDGSSTIEEICVNSDWAYAWTTLSVTMTRPDGTSVGRSGPTLSIYRKEDGRWLLHRDANMLAVAAEKS